MSSRLVSQAAFRLAPCWRFSVQVNQRRFNYDLYPVDNREVNRSVWPKAGCEVNPVRSPSGNQATWVRYAGFQKLRSSFTKQERQTLFSVLDDITFNVSPFAITISSVAHRPEVDREDAIATEDISPESGQASNCAVRSVVIVRGRGDEVRLEEAHAGGRNLDDFRQIGRDNLVQPSITLRGALQDIDWRVVRVVRQHVAKSEGMDDTSEVLARFVERPHRTTGQGLDGVTDIGQGQRGKARGRGRRELRQNGRINAVRTIRSCADESGKRLTQPIRHFAGNVLDSVIDSGCEAQAGEVRVVGILTNRRGSVQNRNADGAADRTFRGLRGIRSQRNVHIHVIAGVLEMPLARSTRRSRLLRHRRDTLQVTLQAGLYLQFLFNVHKWTRCFLRNA